MVGIISDTHGLVRPEAVAALKNCELIIHAGDIGKPEILEALRGIAPVVAVRGNNDKGAWAEAIAEREMVEVRGVPIYVLHDLKELDLDASAAGLRVVVSGHSHKPSIEERQGIVYINPGSAGPRRFKLPVCVARMKVTTGRTVKVELVELTV